MSISITPERITTPYVGPGKMKGGNLLVEPAVLPAHIDIPKTITLSGIDPRYLKPSSCKTVITDCEICHRERQMQFRLAMTQRKCSRCSNRLNAREPSGLKRRSDLMKAYYKAGGKHPTKGIGHSKAACEKISKSQKGIPKVLSPEGRIKMIAHCRKVLLDPIQSEQTRRINRLRIGPLSPSYGKPPAHAKKIWHTKPDGSEVCFRSTWEGFFATYLDQSGVDWTYEPKTFPVEYVLDSCAIQGTYTPDFWTSSGWYEVKGRWTPVGRAKFDAFVRQYDEKITIVDRAWLISRDLL